MALITNIVAGSNKVNVVNGTGLLGDTIIDVVPSNFPAVTAPPQCSKGRTSTNRSLTDAISTQSTPLTFTVDPNTSTRFTFNAVGTTTYSGGFMVPLSTGLSFPSGATISDSGFPYVSGTMYSNVVFGTSWTLTITGMITTGATGGAVTLLLGDLPGTPGNWVLTAGSSVETQTVKMLTL